MNRPLFTILSSLLLFSHAISAATITQCTQPDGTIEFTNQGCSKSNKLYSRQVYSRSSTLSLISKNKLKRKRSSAFLQPAFIQLQKALMRSKTLKDIEELAQTITNKVNSHAQQGKINAAYNMIAATYVKLSKHMKQKQWEGQTVKTYIPGIRTLFEDILITQSTTTSATEFNHAIENAWSNYQKNS